MKKIFYQLTEKEAFIKINAITSYGHHEVLGYYIICDGQIFKGLKKKEYEKIKNILDEYENENLGGIK